MIPDVVIAGISGRSGSYLVTSSYSQEPKSLLYCCRAIGKPQQSLYPRLIQQLELTLSRPGYEQVTGLNG
jgi:hypothetical protein